MSQQYPPVSIAICSDYFVCRNSSIHWTDLAIILIFTIGIKFDHIVSFISLEHNQITHTPHIRIKTIEIMSWHESISLVSRNWEMETPVAVTGKLLFLKIDSYFSIQLIGYSRNERSQTIAEMKLRFSLFVLQSTHLTQYDDGTHYTSAPRTAIGIKFTEIINSRASIFDIVFFLLSVFPLKFCRRNEND